MKVQVHTYDAEMGRTGGGVFNLTAQVRLEHVHGLGLRACSVPKSLVESAPDRRNSQGQPNVAEYWRNGGGGGGGPIVKNKTFFWVAGEKYVDNQPQTARFLVPTTAELTGNFYGVTRSGAQVTIKDPLTGVAVPGQQSFRPAA